MDITNLPPEPPGRPKGVKSAFEKAHEDILRSLGPVRQMQEMQDMVKRYSPGAQIEELMRQTRPQREILGMLERAAIPKHIQDIIDGTSIAAQAKRLMEQTLPKNAFASLGQENEAFRRAAGLAVDDTSIAAQAKRFMEQTLPKDTFAGLGRKNDAFLKAAGLAADDTAFRRAAGLTALGDEAVRRMAGLTIGDEALKRAAGFTTIGDVAKQYEQFLKPVWEQDLVGRAYRDSAVGGTAKEIAKWLEQANPVFREMEAAKKSLDDLWRTFGGIDLSHVEADEEEEEEAAQAAQAITLAAVTEPTLKEAVDQIVAAIEAQQHPAVKVLLWLYFKKVMEWLITGAIGAVMGYYAPNVLGSPQAEAKAVKEIARQAVGAPELLLEYRYVSAKVLIVRQNPRARSPEVGRLTFGKAVKLVKKEKDFALVLWTDKESGAEIQGWVFARYLAKFS
jgi:hypothetical protein